VTLLHSFSTHRQLASTAVLNLQNGCEISPLPKSSGLHSWMVDEVFEPDFKTQANLVDIHNEIAQSAESLIL
jgi:hypothetical protein